MRKKFFIIILVIISLLFISILGGYIAFNSIKIENKVEKIENEIEEVEEDLKELNFYTRVNPRELLEEEKARALVNEYFQGNGRVKEDRLIGKTDDEIREIIGISPLYEMKYEEYFNGELKNSEKPKLMWKYMVYDRDDSGLHLLFEWSEEKIANVVVSAYIDTLSSENYLELYEIRTYE